MSEGIQTAIAIVVIGTFCVLGYALLQFDKRTAPSQGTAQVETPQSRPANLVSAADAPERVEATKWTPASLASELRLAQDQADAAYLAYQKSSEHHEAGSPEFTSAARTGIWRLNELAEVMGKSCDKRRAEWHSELREVAATTCTNLHTVFRLRRDYISSLLTAAKAPNEANLQAALDTTIKLQDLETHMTRAAVGLAWLESKSAQ